MMILISPHIHQCLHSSLRLGLGLARQVSQLVQTKDMNKHVSRSDMMHQTNNKKVESTMNFNKN